MINLVYDRDKKLKEIYAEIKIAIKKVNLKICSINKLLKGMGYE